MNEGEEEKEERRRDIEGGVKDGGGWMDEG
jgi:hypothetical protein